MVRLRATLVVEYEADPADYDTDDPIAMAAIDFANWQEDPFMVASSFHADDATATITVEPF